MEFLKTLMNNKRLVFQLGKNDFRNRFAGTSLGAIWGFVSPFIFMLTYVIVFQYILKTGSSGNDPYIVLFLPGMSMWMFLSDSIISASNSVRNYSYLVKKVVFPVDIIPIISLTASSIIGIFLFTISVTVCAVYGYLANIFELIYVLIAAYALIISITRLTSAICTLVPDFTQLLSVCMQLFMWLTPIMWNLSMLSGHHLISEIVKCMPFTYLITAFREVFIDGNILYANNGLYTLVFWTITILFYVWGNFVFKKNKKDFADVL
jgi:ABC-type polysaccharide/polyol phosphate export permease